jgi:DNA invertase Pin-like site-specific DNA recombinase
VVKLGRLGRNTRDVLISRTNLKKKEQAFGCWSLPSIPAGRWAACSTVLGMVAEMELGFIRDRQHAGIEGREVEGD